MEQVTEVSNPDEFIWCQKYRPNRIEDCILPKEVKAPFLECLRRGSVPHMLLTGTPGTGKTTAAKALCEELGLDYIVLNGSDEGRTIDTFRTTIKSYASSVSFNGKKKVIIIDEADYMNPESVQPALRNFMEEFSENCSFIFTCNYKAKIIDALHSRCSVIEFKINGKDKPKIALELYRRMAGILQCEGVEYDEKVLAEVIQKHFPDFRKTINELQKYAVDGKVDVGILGQVLQDESFKSLIKHLEKKEFTEARKWLVRNSDGVDNTKIYRKLYDLLLDHLDPGSIPAIVILLADYQYRGAFVADMEIHLMALFTEIMSEAKWR